MKSDKRQRAGVWKFIESIRHTPNMCVPHKAIDRVIRRDRRVRDKALKEAIEELEYQYDFNGYDSISDTDLARSFRDAIDAIRELRAKVKP